MPDDARADDVIVLTKPLGTQVFQCFSIKLKAQSQVAVNCYERIDDAEKGARMSEYFGGDKEPVRQLYYRAVDTMCRLNRDGLHFHLVFLLYTPLLQLHV